MRERSNSLPINIHRETRVGGELRREVAEAAGNRGGGRGGTAKWGGWKWRGENVGGIVLRVGRGALSASAVTDAVEQEAFKDDNCRKLGASCAAERHLVLYVYMTNYLPWCALVDLEPPTELP
jgi:hypothetical protein